MRLYAKIVIPSLNLEYLDYFTTNAHVVVGQIVRVPFKSKDKIGVIFSLSESTDLDPSKIREITEIIPLGIFNINFLKFIKEAANYYFDSVNNFLKLALINDDLLKISPKKNSNKASDDRQIENIELNAEQKEALVKIEQNYVESKYNVTVIQGVTGSGKTELYLKFADYILSNDLSDKQVLILLPEIALTNQLINKIKQRFSFVPAIWHSDTKQSEKKRIYQGVLSGEIRLIIGARSALFLPYKNLALIIVDEEHDQSYKQEEKTLYHARDMAVYRAYHEKFMVLLASATPSIETIQNIIDKKYQLVTLDHRFGGNKMPNFRVIDLRQEAMLPNSWISLSLRKEIIETLKNNQQVLLYLNRRGYAPLSICSHCGFKLTCPNCSAWLVEHKSDNKLKCHHCSYSKVNYHICPSCKDKDCLKPCGPGVERIAEEIKSFLPEVNIAIVTRDTTSSINDSEELFNQIIDNKIQVIIGTQMVAKGHHFPSLTLVGIIDADISFGGADLRATEKTYQLLEQVSGRSGREQQGKVVIQTYDTDNKLLQCVIRNDREGFIAEEIKLRKQFKMPPFSKLVTLLVTSKREEVTSAFAKMLVNAAPSCREVQIFGPSPSHLIRMKDQFRYRILVKISKKFDYSSYLKSWLAKVHVPHYINLRVDIDPYNFM